MPKNFPIPPHPEISAEKIVKEEFLRLKNKRLGAVWTLLNNLKNIKIPKE